MPVEQLDQLGRQRPGGALLSKPFWDDVWDNNRQISRSPARDYRLMTPGCPPANLIFCVARL